VEKGKKEKEEKGTGKNKELIPGVELFVPGFELFVP
jgi:hypothetical protein